MAAPGVAGWQQSILKGVGAEPTPANLKFVNTWQPAEGGSADNNPFNTTQPAPGASSYNSVGVRNYLTPAQGIHATVQTLLNGRYQPILQALRRGTDPRAAALALANSPWGTGSLVLKMLGGSVPVATQSQTPLAPAPTVASPAAPNGEAAVQALLGIAEGESPVGLLTKLENPTVSVAPVVKQTGNVTTGSTGGGLTFRIQGHPTARAAAALKTAEDYLGTPYVYGGEKPGGFDCSGLLQFVWAKNGVSIPRTTYDQFQTGTPVAKSGLQPGDAVFFTGSDPKNGLPGHVAMYLGGGKVIQAPHTGADVEISDLTAIPGYRGARRYA